MHSTDQSLKDSQDTAFTNVNVVNVTLGKFKLITVSASLRYRENCPEVMFTIIARLKRTLNILIVCKKIDKLFST